MNEVADWPTLHEQLPPAATHTESLPNSGHAGVVFFCANVGVLVTLLTAHNVRPVFVNGKVVALPRAMWRWIDVLA